MAICAVPPVCYGLSSRGEAAALVHAVEALIGAIPTHRRCPPAQYGASVHCCPRPQVPFSAGSSAFLPAGAWSPEISTGPFPLALMLPAHSARRASASDAVLNQRGQIDGGHFAAHTLSRRDRRMMSSISVSRRRLSGENSARLPSRPPASAASRGQQFRVAADGGQRVRSSWLTLAENCTGGLLQRPVRR